MKLNIQLFAATKSTTVTESNLDTANNTSTLKIKIIFSANNNQTHFTSKTLYCTCDGVTQSAKVSLSTGGSVTKTFTFNDIDHGSTGTRNVSWKWNCNTGTSVLENISDSGTKTLTQLHTPPVVNSITMVEANQLLVNAGISNDFFVLGLSQKQYTINATYYDNANYDYTTIYNVYSQSKIAYDWKKLETINVLNSTNNILDTATTELKINYTNISDSNILLYYYVYDDMEGSVKYDNNYQPFEYNYQTYNKPTITASVKRDGQTSGKVVLNASGTFHKGTIGTYTQTTPTIKYKYWEAGTTEPATYSNTITSGVTITNDTFEISDLNIGNNYNYQKAYRIKIQVSDNFVKNNNTISFTSIESPELTIAVGIATWTEYPTKVDFYNITKQGNTILVPYTLFESSSGSTSNITLQNDSFANYEYLEVYYLYEASDTNYGEYSAKISSPNGKKIPLTIIVDSGNLYTLYCNYSISGATMTRGTPTQWRFTTSSGNHTRSTPTGCFAITKVVGYK